MIADQAKLVRDLLVLGVAYGRKLDEADLAVYGALIARELDDAEWERAFRYHTSGDCDEPRFMPTPMQLIATGCEGRWPDHGPSQELTAEQREFRQRYLAQLSRPRELGPGSAGHATLLRVWPAMPRVVLSDAEWDRRTAKLREQAAQILEGE